MKDLKNLTFEELKEELAALGEKPYRAGQLYAWMHKRLALSLDDMSDLPKGLRERFKQEYEYTVLKQRRMQCSAIDGTKKYLFELPDGNCIESVLMKYHHGMSLCISSQVGCRMGCSFCASTLGGLVRSLSAAEMLEQVYAASRESGERVDSLVVMGIGEPLDNFNELIRFIHMLTDENGLNLSRRSITVSTSGLVPQIYELADAGTGVTLAVSLHAATDEKRQRIMPVAKTYSIAELMAAADYYFEKTGRRVSLEYALIEGENDSVEDIKALAALAAPRGMHVNLIAVNPVAERGKKAPAAAAVKAFCEGLTALHVNATLRRELGRDIDGACGQLRRAEMQG